MLPWVTLFRPHMTELAFLYRKATLRNAELRSTLEGLQGARFPWESARTGLETSPWELSANNEVHVVANISFSLQQWLITTEGPEFGATWYHRHGKELLESIARYWASRVDFDAEKNAYVIRGKEKVAYLCIRRRLVSLKFDDCL